MFARTRSDLTFLESINFLIAFVFFFLRTPKKDFAASLTRGWRNVLSIRHHVCQALFIFLIHSVCIRYQHCEVGKL